MMPRFAGAAIATAMLLAGQRPVTAHPRAEAPAAKPSPAVDVRLELVDGAVYTGGPFRVRLIFQNHAEPRVLIPASAFERDAFVLAGERGRRPRPAKSPAAALPPAEPLDLDGYLTTSREVDLASWHGGMTSRGAVWNLTWKSGDLSAGPLRIVVVKPHDPKKDRFAVVTTDIGRMTWTLMPEEAPRRVKRFVDLVRQGFYDGLSIYRVIPGVQAEGGDPRGDGTGGWENLMMGEMSPRVRPAVGLVGSLRRETSMTSDSLFFITLSPAEFMIGKQTFFARVTKGIEVVARLNRVPTNGDSGLKGAYLTTPPVRIRKIQIR